MTPMSVKKTISSLLEKFAPVVLLLIVVLAFAVGFLWQKVAGIEKIVNPKAVAGQPTQAPTDPTGKLSKEAAKNIPEVTSKDHIFGSKDAEIKIVTYTDLECPFCKRFHDTLKQAIAEYDGKVAMVFRHFPLEMLHKQARPEAEASECVAKLGGEEAFNSFIDNIFETTTSNDGLDLTLLPKFATQAGVKLADYNACVKNSDTKSIVDNQAAGGSKAGVTGTPGAFAVNKKGEAWLIPGAVPLETLKATIELALK